MKKLAPICLFVYNRLKETKQTIDALKNNHLALESELFIFSDGPKKKNSNSRVIEVREYLQSITGFKNIVIYESNKNKGLANSIINGVSFVFGKFDKIIVLEDDLVTSPNFLDFMNQALDFHKEDLTVFSISGYSMDLPSLVNYDKDYYSGFRASSWGWGSWQRSWSDIDWEIKDYKKFSQSKNLKMKFRRGGNDLPRMLKKQMNKELDSWAIRWCFNQFKRNQLTIFPSISKVESIGFGKDATHTKSTNRFDTILDTSNKRLFLFDSPPLVSTKLLKEFKSKFSLYSRIVDKLLNSIKIIFK